METDKRRWEIPVSRMRRPKQVDHVTYLNVMAAETY
jgi:hypothetical protein